MGPRRIGTVVDADDGPVLARMVGAINRGPAHVRSRMLSSVIGGPGGVLNRQNAQAGI
jgi:hypothetical protein